MLEQAVSSPAVRAALARQTQSLGQETAAGLRRRAVRADDAAERAPRRWLRKRRAPGRARAGRHRHARDRARDRRAARAADLPHDRRHVRPDRLARRRARLGLAASARSPASAGRSSSRRTSSSFWTGAGQTPGMRLMRPAPARRDAATHPASGARSCACRPRRRDRDRLPRLRAGARRRPAARAAGLPRGHDRLLRRARAAAGGRRGAGRRRRHDASRACAASTPGCSSARGRPGC